jgi:adhesin transport system outer membrane protein
MMPIIKLKKVPKYFCVRILIASSFFIFSNQLNAASLEEALSSSLKNNADIKLEESRLNRVKATKGDAISEFLPDIHVTYQRGQQKNDALEEDRGELDKRNDKGVAKINFTQPIFNGFSSYNNSKKIKFNIKAAQEEFESKKFGILLEATEAYLNLFKVRNLLRLKNEDEENTKKLLDLIKERNKFGDVGGSEVIKYQTHVSTAISDTLTAQKDLFKAQAEYEKIIGEIDEDLSYPNINKDEISKNRQELIEIAVRNNPNLQNYAFKVKSAKSAVNQSKGKFSPIVEISASMSEEQNVTYLANNSDLRSESVFLNVKIPLFQKGTEYYSMDKARKDLKFSQREYHANKVKIIKEVKQAHEEFIFYENLIKSQEELVDLTNNRIVKVQEQVEVGSGDIIDLLEIKLELNKILSQQLNNQADYIFSYYKLLMLTDTLKI